jgi:hypothetical protein
MGVRYDHNPWRLERNADIADSLAPEMLHPIQRKNLSTR